MTRFAEGMKRGGLSPVMQASTYLPLSVMIPKKTCVCRECSYGASAEEISA